MTEAINTLDLQMFAGILSSTIFTLFGIGVLADIHTKTAWKTLKIRRLVYEGVVSGRKKQDPNFVETEEFKHKFRKAFDRYDLSLTIDGHIKPADVEIFFLDLVVNDILVDTLGATK